MLLTLTSDFFLGFDNLKVTEIEVFETIDYANFDDVAPGWRNEYKDEKT